MGPCRRRCPQECTVTTQEVRSDAPGRTPRTRFVRSRTDRVFRGIAGGLGARIGVDPVLLRIAFVMLSLAGGAGLLLYGLALTVSDEPAPGEDPPARPLDLQQAAAVGLLGLGVMLTLRAIGLWFGDALVFPAVLAGIGSAVIWTRGNADGTAARVPSDTLGLRGPWSLTVGRIVVGATTTVAGLLLFLSATDDPFQVIGPLAGILIGAVLLLAPWLLRLWEQLSRERDLKARSEAREEVAAHLHDSVLQTLALIQRSSEHPRRMVALARRQERELRAWLYGERDRPGAVTSLATAVDDLVGEVEAAYTLDVDTVVVGDAPIEDTVTALLAATREALVNVGKHAGVEEASLYVEAEGDRVTAFVRDRGAGFDPAAVPQDRQGLRGSVRGRLDRAGGGATILSQPGDGTEVELWVPRRSDNGRRRDERTAP